MTRVLSIWILLMMFFVPFNMEAQENISINNHSKSIRIDEVNISKNWISQDFIIKKELLFKEGDNVTFGQIDTSMTNIWNMGNFVDVKYSIKKKSDKNILELTAQDAVRFYPVISINHSSENDYLYNLGYADDNFFGTNTKLQLLWSKKPTGTLWDFNMTIPRQLLYKNMTLSFGYNTGDDSKVFLEREIIEENDKKVAEYKTLMLAPYNKQEIYLNIGNPWNLDYKYQFSPDISFRYISHKVNHSLIEDVNHNSEIIVPEKEYNMIGIGVSESIGIINVQRHRKNGYKIYASYNLNLGYNGTKTIYGFGFGGQYHKIFNKIVQFSAWGRTGITTASDQYKHILGPGDVLGIRYGELYGKTYYSAYVGAHFTWVNNKWISVENAYFINWGAADDSFTNLYAKKPAASIGTSFEFRLPIVPIISFGLTLMYAGLGTEWFKINI